MINDPSFIKKFPNDESYDRFLLNEVNGGLNSTYCPKCNKKTKHRLWQNGIASGVILKCTPCGNRHNHKVGTFLEQRKIPANIWFELVYLLYIKQNGVTIGKIIEILGKTDKGADHVSFERLLECIEIIYLEKENNSPVLEKIINAFA